MILIWRRLSLVKKLICIMGSPRLILKNCFVLILQLPFKIGQVYLLAFRRICVILHQKRVGFLCHVMGYSESGYLAFGIDFAFLICYLIYYNILHPFFESILIWEDNRL